LKTINRFIVILILAVSFQFCNFNSEPEKVWGLRSKIVKLAESLKGIRYRYGGSEIYGFDCSGFVKYVYGSFGIDIPRTAKKQGKIKHKGIVLPIQEDVYKPILEELETFGIRFEEKEYMLA